MKLLLAFIITCFAFSMDVKTINQQSYTLIDYMKRVEEFPREIEGRRVKEWILEDKFPSGRLYIGDRELREEDIKEFVKGTNLEVLGESIEVQHGWTLRRTNMRMYPSEAVVHKGNPEIDYNQYTLLEPFTPLAILHLSKDGGWLYVHAPYMRGWVRKRDVYVSGREKLLEVLQKPFLVVTKGSINIGGFTFGLGSRVPYVEKRGKEYRVLLPNMKSIWVHAWDGLEEAFPGFSEAKVKVILEDLLGTPYDWGGKEGRWDCSSLVQGLYAVFGLELPRNSSQQAKIGRVVATGFSSYDEFKRLIQTLPPFRTLLFMKGHVMVYGGIEEGDIVIYHSVHKLTQEDGTRWYIKAIAKNYVERHRLRNLYKSIVSVNVLD